MSSATRFAAACSPRSATCRRSTSPCVDLVARRSPGFRQAADSPSPLPFLPQFVTFVDPACAASFHQWANVSGLMLNSRRLKIGWGKHSGPLSPQLQAAVGQGASRNICQSLAALPYPTLGGSADPPCRRTASPQTSAPSPTGIPSRRSGSGATSRSTESASFFVFSRPSLRCIVLSIDTYCPALP
jgi:hypothetical protein